MTGKLYLSQLTFLRFIAATYVIAYHYFQLPGMDLLNRFFSRGHIGVPFFFLLSGYVLGLRYGEYDFETPKSVIRFVKKRLKRITPIYLLALIPMIPIVIYLNGFNYKELVYQFMHVFYLQSMLPLKAILNSLNIHSWSLSVEAFLYITAPMTIPLIYKAKNIKLVALNLMGTMILCWLLQLFALKIELQQLLIIDFFAPMHVPVFCLGIIFSRIYKEEKKLVAQLSHYKYLLALIIIGSFFLDIHRIFFSSFNPLYALLFGLLILSLSTSKRIPKDFVYLGDISFAMYMLQNPVKQVFTKILILINFPTNGFTYCCMLLIAIVIASSVLHKIDGVIQKRIT